MSIKGLSLRYAGCITSLTIPKGTVHIDYNNLEKCKVEVLLSNS